MFANKLTDRLRQADNATNQALNMTYIIIKCLMQKFFLLRLQPGAEMSSCKSDHTEWHLEIEIIKI